VTNRCSVTAVEANGIKRKKETGMFTEILGKIGEFETVYTMVDYYQYIKTVEYLICVGFFVAFPMFFKYINEKPGELGK
jgi:hypothetical protein